ncbi:MAG: AzlD domain-containing protein [Pseudomonadota bacterium]|nr:AzlD domain-containing protein [Pseudomonadota bacterium]
MDEGLILLTFAGMGVVTYLPRWLPLRLLAEKRLPAWVESWLDLIPASILSALLLPSLVTGGHPRGLDLTRPELIVAIPTLLFALKTKSLGGTVLFGMALFWLAGRLAA